MSGTSLDGVDAILAEFEDYRPRLIGSVYLPYEEALRAELLALNSPSDNELERAAIAANELARRYAAAVAALLEKTESEAGQIKAIGCHGQTVRHRPDLGFTLQLGNPALLAELTGITVIADFRSRDIAAGGQGAPLVPAFHAAMFRHPEHHRVIVNIGGISNITDLPPTNGVRGFDCGPGNVLMDAWAGIHLGKPYDDDGAWAQTGTVIPELLDGLLAEPFFSLAPPKSTGRDLFNLPWLQRFLSPAYRAVDVQATLLQLTTEGIAHAVESYCPGAEEIFLCGGGAHNGALIGRLKEKLTGRAIAPTDALGVDADWVEALAFAWLARQTLSGKPGNLPQVTGARGQRILGAIYPS